MKILYIVAIWNVYIVCNCLAIGNGKSKYSLAYKQSFHSSSVSLDLLQWIVTFKLFTKPREQSLIDSIATNLSLVYYDKLFDGPNTIYLFIHPVHLQDKKIFRKSNNKFSHFEQQGEELQFSFHYERQLEGIHRIKASFGTKNWNNFAEFTNARLSEIYEIEWFKQQTARLRHKREIIYFADPAFDQQWHLVNNVGDGYDINITGVWAGDITGQGVTIAIMDDGIEWTNPDINNNFNAVGSWDFNDNDNDPMPDLSDLSNYHGTRCAGEVAAAANDVCGVGVAYDAKVAGIRILDGPVTDSLEAAAFMRALDINDVFSCSWGPQDNGMTIDGPHYLTNLALQFGTENGRRGYGTIYVVASGNGGHFGDNCNFDGYANSAFTVTIGAIDKTGRMPPYGEQCASMLAVTFSNGFASSGIVTTDIVDRGGCTRGHSGTSAAAPIAAGIIALMLQARPCLYWRDVQHLIAFAAVQVNFDDADWYRNAAGLSHSHKHGFGMMDAWRLVTAARVWEPVPWQTIFTSDTMYVLVPLRTGLQVNVTHQVSQSDVSGYGLSTLEQVHVSVWLQHDRRGDLNIVLYCPSGTPSLLATVRPYDNDSTDGLQGWTFGTVRCWGETPLGTWTLGVTDMSPNYAKGTTRGVLQQWQLILYGSAITSDDVAARRSLVRDALLGNATARNVSTACQPIAAQPRTDSVFVVTERQLLILAVIGALLLFVAIYEMLEFILLYDDEKRRYNPLIAEDETRSCC